VKLEFSVPGEPRGKGRPRATARAGIVRMYTDKQTASYENLIAMAASAAMGVAGLLAPLETPLMVTIGAAMTIPASASAKKRAAMVEGAIRPTKRPDLDQFVKAALDGMNGVVYRDDSQVVTLRAFKVYGPPCLKVTVQEVLP
jgi:Holliday junction resolvase RusA-like endonuclease